MTMKVFYNKRSPAFPTWHMRMLGPGPQPGPTVDCGMVKMSFLHQDRTSPKAPPPSFHSRPSSRRAT